VSTYGKQKPLSPADLALAKDGWWRWPDWVPAPLKGYEFLTNGGPLYSRPECSWWLKVLYGLGLGSLN
jgi:hypothetical protein